MNHAIEHGPAFAWLRVKLAPGEQVQSEAGAMVTMTPGLDMQTRLNRSRRAGFFAKVWGFFVALLRRMFGKESMFVNEFSATSAPGEITFAPKVSGHIAHFPMTGERRVFVQQGGYLASTGTLDTKIRWGGLRALFGGEGLFLLECSGQGDLFVNSYGGITPVAVDGEYVVDTGHIVAFDGALDFKVRGVGGLKSFLFSGEGLVCQFSGRGTVYVQSRNVQALVGWVTPFLR